MSGVNGGGDQRKPTLDSAQIAAALAALRAGKTEPGTEDAGQSNGTHSKPQSLADLAIATGLPVYPLSAERTPLRGSHGFHDATRDPDAIRLAFSEPGAAGIAVRMGEASGLVAIDVDGKPGQRGKEWFEANQHRLPRTRTHRTKSGDGRHYIFRKPEGAEIRFAPCRINKAGDMTKGLACHVDVMGEGCGLNWPGTPGYEVIDWTEPAEMPGWLVDACLRVQSPPEPERTERYVPPPATDRLAKWAAAVIKGECDEVADCVQGRNAQLYDAAVAVGRKVLANGLMARSEVEHALTSAAMAAGLQRAEIGGTIRSGLEWGMRHPAEPPGEDPTRRRRTAGPGAGSGPAEPEPPEPGDPGPGAESDDAGHDGGRDRGLGAGDPGPDHASRPKGVLPLFHIGDVVPILDVKDFVEGVLVEKGATMVYGDSNTGKTFFVLDLACSVAAGKKWFGREVERGGVVYCILEGSMLFQNRLAVWFKENKLDPRTMAFTFVPSALNLLNPDADVQPLIAAIRDASAQLGVPVRLVVVDTMSRALGGGNESTSEDMGQLVTNMDAIREATGANLLFIHHTGKDQARGARGWSGMRGAIDTEIEVTCDETSEAKRRSALISKQRDLEKGDCFGFTLDVVELGTNRRGKPVSSCVVKQGEVKKGAPAPSGGDVSHKARALELLRDLLGTSGVTEAAGVPKGYRSVTVDWWRERFISSSMPEADSKTADGRAAKLKAFGRVTKKLIEAEKRVGMANDRVWLARPEEGKTPFA